eukprot:scaffold42543_cov22-Tisochrysis_lutea.AAC.1
MAVGFKHQSRFPRVKFNARGEGRSTASQAKSMSEKLWGGARGTLGAYAGRVYYECFEVVYWMNSVCAHGRASHGIDLGCRRLLPVTLQDEGLARVGWATTAASLQEQGSDPASIHMSVCTKTAFALPSGAMRINAMNLGRTNTAGVLAAPARSRTNDNLTRTRVQEV